MESILVFKTQIGLVMIWVAAPARREAAKKSVGERWDLIWAWVSVRVACGRGMASCVGVGGVLGESDDDEEGGGEVEEGALR